MIFGGGSTANSIPNTYAEITESSELGFDIFDGSSLVSRVRTSAVLRDPSAWYHICFAIDTSQATASNRIKLFINNVQQTAFSTATYPSQNYDTGVNSTRLQTIGCYPEASLATLYFDGYLAECYLMDGQALTPSSFTETDATTGQLIPKAYTGSYGTNGFRLAFDSYATTAALGTDTSGNGNTWTVNNLSIGGTNYVATGTLSGAATSSLNDLFDGNLSGTYWTIQPAGVYNATVTFSPKLPSGTTIEIYGWKNGSVSSGAVEVNGTDVSALVANNFPGSWANVSSAASGGIQTIKIYRQDGVKNPTLSGIRVNGVVLISVDNSNNDSLVDTPTSYGVDDYLGGTVRGNYCTWNPLDRGSSTGNQLVFSNGNLQCDWTTSELSYAISVGTFGLSYGKWYWEITNNSSTARSLIGVMPSGATRDADSYLGAVGIAYDTIGYTWNRGALNTGFPTFTSGDVVGIALDVDNGKIWFSKNGTWLNSGNPATGSNPTYSSIGATTYFPATSEGGKYEPVSVIANFGQRSFASTAPSGFKALCDTNLPTPVVAKPNTVMDTVLYTGNGAARSITGLAFNPDLVWLKSRSATTDHKLTDSVRGVTKALSSNLITPEATDTEGLTAFNSNGFSLGTDTKYNNNAATYVAWAWDAGTSTVTNTAGSITSQVRANASAGFSIVTATTPASGTFTIGHGLGVAPSLVITKTHAITDGWYSYHKSLGPGSYVSLNRTDPSLTNNQGWQNTDPSSTVVYGTAGQLWNGSASYVIYAFAPVSGYSNGFSYTGNGSADGSFVYLGFRPRLIMLKRSDSTSNWTLLDTSREGYNVDNDPLYPNLSDAEGTADLLDITSNGFKLRSTDASVNASAGTYIGFAWAENPFQYARAR
jgi:hypothetical protein